MTATSLTVPEPTAELTGRRHDSWRAIVGRALRTGRTQAGLAIVGVILLIAVVGPLVAPHPPTQIVTAPFSKPGSGTPLGADYLGRDTVSRFLHGGATILALGFLSTTLGVVSGALVGLVAAFSRRVVDDVLMRLMDLILAFPAIVLVLMFVAVIGPKSWLLILTVGFSYTPQTARVIRTAAFQVRESDFVRYAEGIGVPRRRILLEQVLPNVIAPLTVEFGLRLTYSIGLIASLDYLGFGVQPPNADWGLMIHENQSGLSVSAWPVILPVLAIALITVGINFVTDGIGRAVAGLDRKAER